MSWTQWDQSNSQILCPIPKQQSQSEIGQSYATKIINKIGDTEIKQKFIIGFRFMHIHHIVTVLKLYAIGNKIYIQCKIIF